MRRAAISDEVSLLFTADIIRDLTSGGTVSTISGKIDHRVTKNR